MVFSGHIKKLKKKTQDLYFDHFWYFSVYDRGKSGVISPYFVFLLVYYLSLIFIDIV